MKLPSFASPAASRAAGLDTLRAAAIALVFMYHYMVFVSREPTFGWASVVGWVGVDLFFVLSGYLIANQVFAGMAQGKDLSIKMFYARRALRTLPVFWVVLALYFLFPAVMGGRTPPPLWSFLTFTQNFGLQPGTAFSHAWSLCIEEQFYLVLPLLLVAGLRLGFGRLQGWMLIVGLIALGVTARTLLWFQYGLEGKGAAGYHPNVYYATLCRFDEFLPGVAVAVVKHFHRPLWNRLIQHGQALLAAGVAATGLMLYCAYRFYYIDGYGYGFFMTAFGYSLIAASFALLVLAALSPSSWLARIRIPGAYHLALWSYSIYLSHKAVGHILAQPLKATGWSSTAIVLAVTLASLLCGWLLYRMVEAPFMVLRDRRFPTLFSPGEAADSKLAAKGGE